MRRSVGWLLILLWGLAACARLRGGLARPRVHLLQPAPETLHPLGPGQQIDIRAEYNRPLPEGKVFFYLAWQGPSSEGQMPLRAQASATAQQAGGRWPPPEAALPPGEYTLWVVAYRETGEEYASETVRLALLPAPVSPTPRITPSPTARPSLPTPRPVPVDTPTRDGACYRAAFLEDVTYPDGSVVQVGRPFVKSWRLRNVGVCVWGPGTRVLRVADDGLGAPAEWLLPDAPVLPGETVVLEVTLQAEQAGMLQAAFRLQAVDGTEFGIGPDNGPFWVQVQAVLPSPSPGPSATPR